MKRKKLKQPDVNNPTIIVSPILGTEHYGNPVIDPDATVYYINPAKCML